MPTLREILAVLERLAPSKLAISSDKIGLQIGDPNRQVTRALVSLDRSLMAVKHAADSGCQLLLTHHPLLFESPFPISADDHTGRALLLAAEAKLAIAAAHTNWDCARGGVNDALAAKLGLSDVSSFGWAAGAQEFKLVTFVPAASLEAVTDAASEAGAGQIGDYVRRAFHHTGTGTFEAGPECRPAVGNAGERTSAAEIRLEMLVSGDKVGKVEAAVRKAHPYEEPAIDFFALRNASLTPMGRIGSLPQPMTLAEFLVHTDERLQTRTLLWGDAAKKVKRVAVVGGAADREWRAARSAGADVFVTGEVKQHVALESQEMGMPISAAGHYATEQPGAAALAEAMRQNCPQVEWELFVPEAGMGGRPL